MYNLYRLSHWCEDDERFFDDCPDNVSYDAYLKKLAWSCLHLPIYCLKCEVVQIYCGLIALYVNAMKGELIGSYICYRYKRPLFNYRRLGIRIEENMFKRFNVLYHYSFIYQTNIQFWNGVQFSVLMYKSSIIHNIISSKNNHDKIAKIKNREYCNIIMC